MSAEMQVEFFLNKLGEDLGKLLDDNPELVSADKAFGPWSLMLLVDVPVGEALHSFVEGGGDKGLDVVYVPDEPGTLTVLQAKRYTNSERNLGKNDIVLALNGVRWLLDGDLGDPTVNPALRARAAEFREAYTSYFPRVDIYLVCTSQGPAPNGQAEIDMFLREANSPSEPVFSVAVIDIDELHARFRRALQQTSPNEIVLDFSRPQSFEHDTGEMRAIIGSVSGKTIAELYDAYGNAIVEANVRNYLGNLRINRQIQETAADPSRASRFWFYNNGISIVCSQVSFRSQAHSSRVRLVNAQIVNGCQTVHSLWNAMKNGTLQDSVEVLVRIIEQPDPDFVRLVTRYNNTQNAMRSADLVGRDPVQLRLRSEFHELGFYYETRRGDWRQYYSSRDERIAQFGKDYSTKVITVKEAAQACAAFYLQQPVVAKNKTTLLTTPVVEQGILEDIFSADVSAPKVLGAVELMRRVTAKRKETLRTGNPAHLASHSDWLPHADFFILALIGRQHFDVTSIQSDDQITGFFEEVNRRFHAIHATIVKRIGPFLQDRVKEPGYSHPKFLKTEASWVQLQACMGRRSPIRP